VAYLTPSPLAQFFDANGNPLAGGKLYTYASGTTTPQATYTSRTAGTANANPVILNYRGEASVWLTNSFYTFRLENAAGDLIWTKDGIGNLPTGYYNVLDYGATGDGVTDDTVAIQNVINVVEASTNGGVVYMPAGKYKITANLTITWPKLCVLRGDGSQLSFIWDYRTSVGTGGVITYDASAAAGGDNAYMGTFTGGFSLVKKINYTIVTGPVITTLGTGTGLYANGVVGGVYQDIWATGYNTNIYLIDCLGFAMRDIYSNQAAYGIYLAGYSALSGPNASIVENCIISACGTWGLYIAGGSVQVIGGTFTFCGTMATVSGGICAINDLSLALPQAFTLTGGFFEQNRGSADVYINSQSAVAYSATINDGLYARTDSTYYTTNCIYVLANGNAPMQISAGGNGFRGYNTYVANAARKYIAVAGTYASQVSTNYIGNTYTSATEAPAATGVNFSSLGWGSNGGQLLDIGGVPYAAVTTTSIGLGNTTGGMVLDASAWRPAIAGTFGIGTTTYPVKDVYFGAVGGRMVDISSVPYLYTSSASVGVGNATGGMVLDATAWRPAIASTFGIGTVTYPVSNVRLSGTVQINSSAYIGNSTGNWLSLNGVAEVVPSGGIAPVTTNTYVLGSTSFRWAKLWTYDIDLSNTLTWGAYTIPLPTGSTSTFLRNDGTWATPSGSTNYTYTGTGTGFTTTPTATISYTRVGDIVVMDLLAISGTSNSTAFTITGGTTAMRPATDKQCYVGVADNGVSNIGSVIIKTTGVIEVYNLIGGQVFTASGTKGIYGSSFSYTTV